MSDIEFGKYCLLAELGQGGMANVYLAVAVGPAGVNFTKLVVIKKLKPNLLDDPDFLSMLLDEARLAARLNHPNLVQTYEVGQVGSSYFIAMEYLDGQPLNRLLYRARKLRPIPPEIHYRILADVLSGLHAAHELVDFDGTPLHVVHRDVTPHNIFVTYAGQVKVVDFGIAKAVGRTAETRTGTLKGKLTYMSPEQALAGKVDRRADIFSVGVMLWEAATGSRMWKGLEEVQIMNKLVSGMIPRSPRDIDPNVPEAVDRMCQRALATFPENRYETAAEFQNDLEAYLDKVAWGTATSASDGSVRHLGNRALGAYISELFSDKREEQRAVIERQFAQLRQQTDNFQLISIGGKDTSVPPTSKQTPSTFSSMPSARIVPVGPTPSLRPGSTLEPTGQTAITLNVPGSRDPARRVRQAIYTLVALGGAALAAVVVMNRSRSEAPHVDAPTAAASVVGAPVATEPAAASAAPANSAFVMLSLQASPPEARFAVDDGPAIDNPHVRRVPFDPAKHVIRISAPGYAPKSIVVTLDKDITIDTRLDRLSSASPQPARPQPTMAAPTGKTPGGKKRTLDQDFPINE